VAFIVGIAFTGKAHNEIGWSGVSGRALRCVDQAAILIGTVLAVHRFQHRIGSPTHRQMQNSGINLGFAPCPRFKSSPTVARMAFGGIADAFDASRSRRWHHRVWPSDQFIAVIGVYILAQEHNLARAFFGELVPRASRKIVAADAHCSETTAL